MELGHWRMNVHLAVFVLFVTCTSLTLYGCGEQVCLDNVQENFVVTDDLAVLLSKNALVGMGVDVSNMEPKPYGHDGKLFARNKINSNDGYVLWGNTSGPMTSGYSVTIRRNGTKIYCDAGKNF